MQLVAEMAEMWIKNSFVTVIILLLAPTLGGGGADPTPLFIPLEQSKIKNRKADIAVIRASLYVAFLKRN